MTAGNQKRATDLMRGWPALVRARGDARSFLGNVMNGYLLLLYAQQSGFHDVRGALVMMLGRGCALCAGVTTPRTATCRPRRR
jgi:hypothetical protein